MSSVNGVNGTKSAEKLLTLNMMQSALKSSFGDGTEFEMVYQSILDSLEDPSSSTSKSFNSLFNTDTSTDMSTNYNSSVSAGQVLEDLPLEINNELGNLTYNGYLNSYNINNASSVSTNSSDASIKEIYDTVNKYASKYGVDPKLVLGVIKAESNFNSNAVSPVGAKGLMQLMPSVCQDMGVSNPYNIDENIKGGVKLLKTHLDKYNGNISMALMAYNAGPGTVQSRGVISVSDLYKMPTETQNYVKKIMSSL